MQRCRLWCDMHLYNAMIELNDIGSEVKRSMCSSSQRLQWIILGKESFIYCWSAIVFFSHFNRWPSTNDRQDRFCLIRLRISWFALHGTLLASMPFNPTPNLSGGLERTYVTPVSPHILGRTVAGWLGLFERNSTKLRWLRFTSLQVLQHIFTEKLNPNSPKSIESRPIST